MNICIYCKKEITRETESIEHVFPAAFGCPDDYVLDCVCEPCNNLFGGSIEKWLASDSLESIMRLKILGSQSQKNVRSRRLKLSVPKEEMFGEFQGALFERDFTSGQLILALQAGFKNEKGEYEYFTDKELGYPEIQEKVKKLSNQDIKVLGQPKDKEDGYKNIVEQLEKIGIKFTQQKEINLSHTPANGEMMVPAAGQIDPEIQRAIAKIAFNYLAKNKGADYVLQSKFDVVRDFINGVKYYPIVKPVREPVLLDDSHTQRYLVHIFIVERVGNELGAIISLFNQGMSYRVLLSVDMGPFWEEIVIGHSVNPLDGHISPLGYIKK